MKKKILCLSRSYLSKLFPTIAQNDNGREYFHIVQNTAEEKRVKSLGGEVVLNIETYVSSVFTSNDLDIKWEEPDDFRTITGFNWSPLYTDRYLSNFPEATRLKVAGAVYKAISELFSKYNFDYFLSEPVALFTTHVLLYFCKKNETEARLWVNCYFPDYFFFAAGLDYSIPSPVLKQYSKDEISLLDKHIKSYCEGVQEDKTGPAYHFSFSKDPDKGLNYFQQRVGNASLVLKPELKTIVLQSLRVIRAIYSWSLFPKKGDFQSAASFNEHWFYFKCLLTSRKYYDNIPDRGTQDVITYTLQYEPEASLLYAAPDFYNQLVFVEMILRSLPDGQSLYVKEHPNQFGALGIKEWRKLRKKYHHLKFIYGRESGRELIKSSSMVITLSSTAGMDAILLGKPVIVAGRVFFSNFPNVKCINSYSELAALLQQPHKALPTQDIMQDILNHFRNMGINSYLGDPQPSSILYSDENLTHLINAISQECN